MSEMQSSPIPAALSGAIHRQKIWLVAAALLVCALPFGWLGAMAAGIWLALCSIEASRGWPRALATVATALLMLAAALGAVPGGERLELISPYTDAAGNNIGAAINPGKAMIALAMIALLAHGRQLPQRGDWPYIAAAALIPVLCAAALFGFSFKFAPAIVVAALVNLVVVCISEEGFFRWILQRGLERVLGRWRWLAVVIVALVFTALHTGWAASPLVLLLVGIAGLCYGTLWYLRGNFWACVAAHWSVNALHLLLLPYPLH